MKSENENENKICVYVSDGKDWHHVGGDGDGCTPPLQPATSHGETIELICGPSPVAFNKILTKEEFDARYESKGWKFPTS